MSFGKRRPENRADPGGVNRTPARARYAIPAILLIYLGVVLAASGVVMSTLELAAEDSGEPPIQTFARN